MTYVVSVNYNWSWNRAIAATASGLASTVANGPLSTLADGQNGLFGGPGSLPTETSQNANYFRDVVLSPSVHARCRINRIARRTTGSGPTRENSPIGPLRDNYFKTDSESAIHCMSGKRVLK